jgi:hypothetical protein
MGSSFISLLFLNNYHGKSKSSCKEGSKEGTCKEEEIIFFFKTTKAAYAAFVVWWYT